MPKGLVQDKIDLLVDLYGYTLVSEGSHWIKPANLKQGAHLLVSTAYVTLLLESLLRDTLIECNIDDNADEYAIVEAGVIAAEEYISEKGLTLDQFEADWKRRFNTGLIVSLDQLAPDITEARRVLEQLDQHLRFDNDIGQMSSEDKSVAIEEISELRETLSKSTIRINSLWTKSHEALVWIMEKAAGSVTGELAKQALHSIQHFVNVFFN